MKQVQIPKKSGGFRNIYVVKGDEAIVYRNLIGEVAKRARDLDKESVVHGFVRGKSPVTAAKVHVGYSWSVCFDIENFFDNVTRNKLSNNLSSKVLDIVLVDGAARQGLPTSPSVANIAAYPMDKAILRFLNKSKLDIVYTRYADDLTFSGNDDEHINIILNNIPRIVSKCGWALRKEKTHIQISKSGRRHICGVSVGPDNIHPTRRTKRKLRAALHQGSLGSESAKHHAQGLLEYSKLKEPNKVIYNNCNLNEQLKSLGKIWKTSVPKFTPEREEIICGDLLITGDPIYMLGCSTWTTGWTSCLAHPSGKYRKSSVWWCKAPGTRVATLLSSKTKEFGGVQRKVMRARAFVHQLENGTLVYDRIYGEHQSRDELALVLQKQGIVSVGSVPKGLRVQGYVIGSTKPYLDSLKANKINIIRGKRKLKAIALYT